MKKIVLSLGVLLVFAQNGFALVSEDQFNKIIKQTQQDFPALSQLFKCEKTATYHFDTGNVNECLNSIEFILEGKSLGALEKNRNHYLAESYLNAGVLYHNSEKNYLKAYEYYMKSAKSGDTTAQKYLSQMCKVNSWACK